MISSHVSVACHTRRLDKGCKTLSSQAMSWVGGRGKKGEGRVSSTSICLILALVIEYHRMYFSTSQKSGEERTKMSKIQLRTQRMIQSWVPLLLPTELPGHSKEVGTHGTWTWMAASGEGGSFENKLICPNAPFPPHLCTNLNFT